jgi:GDP-4-dehydro-6-deoxy-D-mannose reductase
LRNFAWIARVIAWNPVTLRPMQEKRLFITGASGFVGQWCLRSPLAGAQWRIEAAPDSLDLTKPGTIAAALGENAPDAVLHLAGQAFVPTAFQDPQGTLDVNLSGTLNLLQALAKIRFQGRFIYVSSADIYGQVAPEQMPIREDILPRPRNPYAVSKEAAEALCRQWHFSEGLDLVIARPFNHIGPGQSERFVVSDLTRQFARIKAGLQSARITMGNVNVSRDFTDVRDVVRAYLSLVEQGQRGETYNICSGRAVALAQVIDELQHIAGVLADIEVDPTRIRSNEQLVAYGSADLITQATGWQPAIGLQQSLRDTYEYWTREIQA